MDRNTVLRWAFIALAAFAFMKWGPNIFGKKEGSSQSIPFESYVSTPGYAPDGADWPPPAENPPEGELCDIKGNRFEAQLSSRGASLVHYWLRDSQYAEGTNGYDLATTQQERWRTLRTLFRGEGADDQLKYDRFPWKLEKIGDTGCAFSYEDADVSIKKTVTAGTRPFELNVETSITNLDDAPKKHRFSISAFAFRMNKDVKGKLGRTSPFATDLQCARDGDVTRKPKDGFKEGWYREPLVDRFTAISDSYFAQALVPSVAFAPGAPDGTEKPECSLLAEDKAAKNQDMDADESGDVYHATLTYPPATLAPHQTSTYSLIAYIGPKERNVLAKAAGGGAKLGDLINLGFFSPVARVLVGALVFFHGPLQNWGLAIIALTLCLRIGLFPLSWKQIQTSIAMKKLKPELDELNKRFPDDAQARQMATMEIYRKNGVNPLGGCLPQLVQLPVWWAMWATLQTAVEMYHEKFLWITDLSAPDKYFILPIVYGVFIVLQQRITPQQGMDPMQQKMMTYMMPGLFTVLVLFLPAALGIYMLTSSALGIGQQLVVQKIVPTDPTTPKKGEIVVKQVKAEDGAGAKTPAFGKGKARV
jgi:YidC/Oxa1 family membrane protein insertase